MVTARTRVLIKFTLLLTLNNLKHAEDILKEPFGLYRLRTMEIYSHNRVREIYNIYGRLLMIYEIYLYFSYAQ